MERGTVRKGRLDRLEDRVLVDPGPRPRVRVQDSDGTISPGPDYPGPYEPDILIVPAEKVIADQAKDLVKGLDKGLAFTDDDLAGKSPMELDLILAALRSKVPAGEKDGKE